MSPADARPANPAAEALERLQAQLQGLQAQLQGLQAQLQPWYDAVEDPAKAQEGVLHTLLKDYARTDYGAQHGAGQIGSLDDYRRAFPVVTYEEVKPLIQRVMGGEVSLLLCEEPVGWAITRGTTGGHGPSGGESKFIPMTPTDLRMRVSAGRAMMNYVLSSKRFDLFQGVNLNLNFPSVVGTMRVGEREVEYGYSSGIYTKYVSRMTPIRSVPSQEEIDALGGGKTVRDWENRFELAYERCKDENVTLVGGVCPTALRFARYLRRVHRVYPKDLWRTQIMTLGSTPGINTRHEPALHAMYGDSVVLREIYGATEGMFGQQRDAERAWTPNYDMFFFEVQGLSPRTGRGLSPGTGRGLSPRTGRGLSPRTGRGLSPGTERGCKMLHEMRPGEMGTLVVSTPVLPRYRIGDVILALQPPYFRCIGRERWWTPLRYYWDEVMSGNFGRL